MTPDNSIYLLLLLARVKPSEDCLGKAAEIIGKGIDWERFSGAAMAHGVAPLIYGNIGRMKSVPSEVGERLRRAYLFNAADAIRTACQLRELAEAFAGECIEPLMIKGVLLAEEVLGDAALYPSSDVDILVKGEDRRRAAELMKMKGYSEDPETRAFPGDNNGELSFFREGAKVVEIHSRIGARRYFMIPEQFWWEGARERVLDGRAYKTFSPENNLLLGAIHLFGHGCAPFKFVVRIAEMLRVYQNDLDWTKLIEDARTIRALKPLLLSFSLSASMLDAPLPAAVTELLKECSPKERWIFRKMEKLAFRGDANLSVVMFLLTLLQYDLYEVGCRLLRWIFPPPAEISRRYQLPLKSKRVFLYYLLNPVLLLFRRRQV